MPPNQNINHEALNALLLPNGENVTVNFNGHSTEDESPSPQGILRCAILGCGMMGQEHCSYIAGFPQDLRIDFLCDPHPPSLDKCAKVWHEFASAANPPKQIASEEELLEHHVHDIDLLVIASPNYLHTDTLLRWGRYEHLTILVEKPVAVSEAQLQLLMRQNFVARIWVAMEYRFIPAIAKLIELLPETVGDIKMVTIRENRYPFLHKIGAWNRDRAKTGDSLVEKCCHFFDLFRLITGKEANLPQIRALAQRSVNYDDEDLPFDTPIIDAAYVTLPFLDSAGSVNSTKSRRSANALGCLELCMYAEGSRHQEEIIVTGTKGRLEAYLPENKVYAFQRPSQELWTNRSEPPPPCSIGQRVYDCSDVRQVHGIASSSSLPTHGGYHYSSTAVEWFKLVDAIRNYEDSGVWKPLVSLQDGIRAVEMGLQATRSIVNEQLPPSVEAVYEKTGEEAILIPQSIQNSNNFLA